MNLNKSYTLALLFFGIMVTSVEAQLVYGIFNDNTVAASYLVSLNNTGYGYDNFDGAGSSTTSSLFPGLRWRKSENGDNRWLSSQVIDQSITNFNRQIIYINANILHISI